MPTESQMARQVQVTDYTAPCHRNEPGAFDNGVNKNCNNCCWTLGQRTRAASDDVVVAMNEKLAIRRAHLQAYTRV